MKTLNIIVTVFILILVAAVVSPVIAILFGFVLNHLCNPFNTVTRTNLAEVPQESLEVLEEMEDFMESFRKDVESAISVVEDQVSVVNNQQEFNNKFGITKEVEIMIEKSRNMQSDLWELFGTESTVSVTKGVLILEVPLTEEQLEYLDKLEVKVEGLIITPL